MRENWSRVTVREPGGDVLFFAPEQVFYLEAEDDDTLVRTARRRRYRSSQRLRDLARRLPSPPFFRCHESYIVNLARVRKLERRGTQGWQLRLDPPVNQAIPVSRYRLDQLRKLTGAP